MILRRRKVNHDKKNRRILTGMAGKFGIGIITPLLLFSLLFSGVLYFVGQSIINRQVMPQFESRLSSNMRELHNSVSPELVQGAINNKEDYAKLLSILNKFKHSTQGIQNAYVMSKVNGKDVILALSDDNKYLYPLAFTDQQNQSLQTNQPIMSSIYSDAWGIHKSLFVPYGNANSIIGLDIDAAFIPALQHLIMEIDALIILGAILVGAVISFYEARYFSKPIITLSKWANQLAEGNLSTDVIQANLARRNDEVGELSDSFSKMAQNLRNIVDSISNTADHVASTAEELSASAEETAKATNQIADSIQEVASGAEKQATGTSEASKAMEDMTTGVHHIAETSSAVADSATNAASTAEDGKLLVENTIHQMESIYSSISDTEGLVKELNQHSQSIGQIVDVITGIAGQTNLLALNAAIEAARAGEEGRGFAVVAEEVRKLAEQSADSAQQIVSIIAEVQSGTEKSLASMELAMEKAKAGLTAIQDTGHSFNNILNETKVVANQVQEVSLTSKRISEATGQVASSIEEMASISLQSSANAQNVSAASEEQLASIEEIAGSANSLSESAQELQRAISQFRL